MSLRKMSMLMAPGSHLPCARPAYSLCPIVRLEFCARRRLIAAQLRTSASYCASGQFVRCAAVGLVPLLAHSIPIMCQLPILVGSHGYMPTPACHATPTATTVTVPSRAMCSCDTRPRQVRPADGDGCGAGVVRSGVVHHDTADVLEIAVAAVAPTGILDEPDTLGAQHVREPHRVAGPRSCLGHGVSFRRCRVARNYASQPGEHTFRLCAANRARLAGERI